MQTIRLSLYYHSGCSEITVPNQLYNCSVGPDIPFFLTAVILPSLLDLASVMDSSSVSVLQPRPGRTLSNPVGIIKRERASALCF